jgi:signal transduction histidine kinase
MVAARKRLKEQAVQRALAETEFTAILRERNRIAREIHDTLAQGLGAISMQLELAKTDADDAPEPLKQHLAQAHTLVRSSLADARDSIWNMRSQVLETGDLASALDGILRQLADGTGIESRMQVTGRQRRLSPVMENNLLRIGQEAITNAMKHAKAKHIEVKLEFDEKSVRLSVRDDGQGFRPNGLLPQDGGFGLVGMRERAAHLGCELNVTSVPGNGTEISLEVLMQD